MSSSFRGTFFLFWHKVRRIVLNKNNKFCQKMLIIQFPYIEIVWQAFLVNPGWLVCSGQNTKHLNENTCHKIPFHGKKVYHGSFKHYFFYGFV